MTLRLVSSSIHQPVKVVTVVRGDLARQDEIELRRAAYRKEFDRIEAMSPSVEELLSITCDPPREWLDQRWP